MKALIMTAQPQMGKALQESFEPSGFEVQVESSALYAMTLLERNRPDVIISTEKLSEMDGVDFYSMVREDPQLALVPFVLLSSSGQENLGDLDTVLPKETRPSDVVRTAYKLILDLTRKTFEIPASGPPVRTSTIQGQLGDISLFELAQWLAKSVKTGRLTVELMGGLQATCLFIKGQLRHAEFAGRRGEDAVLHLLMQSEDKKQGKFDFEPLKESDFSLEPVTIRKTTDQLLLSLAVQLDHGQQKIN